MRELTFTYYQDLFDTTGGKVRTASWDEWAEALTAHTVRGKPSDTSDPDALERGKRGDGIVLGEIPEGRPRKDNEVAKVHALALDIEHRTVEEIEKVLEGPFLAPLEWVAHSTHRSGAACNGGEIRMRVIVPLAEPISAKTHRQAWLAFNDATGGVTDRQTKNPSRFYYLPSTYDPAKAWRHRNATGKLLDVGELLGRSIKGEAQPQATEANPEDLPPPDYTFPAAPAPQPAPYDPRTETQRQLEDSESAMSMLRKLKLVPDDHPAKAVIRALLEGRPIAQKGDRHRAILDLTWFVAMKDPKMSEGSVALVFAKSVDAMRREDPGSPGLADVLAAYRGAVEKQKESSRQRAAEKCMGPAEMPYTPQDLERIAAAQGWQISDLRHRWIIQKDSCFYFLDQNGHYKGPYAQNDARVAARDVLGRAPVQFVEATSKGVRRKSILEMAEEAGCVANKINADLTRQYSGFDPSTAIVMEATAPLRPLREEFSPEIDQWARVFAGPLYEKFYDWLACVPDCNKMLCALYLAGHPGTGKSLLPLGLAHLWHEGPPCSFDQIMLSNFNEQLATCPIILGDESVPKNTPMPANARIREELAKTSRELKRKFRPIATLNGAIRLILSANHEAMLDTRDVQTMFDQKAVAQRILFFRIPALAADFIKPEVTERRWLKEDMLAKHVLWLARNRAVQRGKRFWVEGDESEMHRFLVTSSHWNSLICEWLVRYLQNPQAYDAKGDSLIRAQNGQLLVNDQAIIDGWEMYLGHAKTTPETAKIGTALRGISKSEQPRSLRLRNGRRVRYREIEMGFLLDWSKRNNIGDEHEMLAKIGAPKPARKPEDDNVEPFDSPKVVQFPGQGNRNLQ